MRYAAEHKSETRARILRAASRRFRRHGAEGAAISTLMRDLRLTHGGFYRHFASKEALFSEALAAALVEVSDRLAARADAAPAGQKAGAVIDAYLSAEHCDDFATGCPVAALASELARHPAGGGRVFQRATEAHLTRMAAYLPGNSAASRYKAAAILFSGMAGTLAMTRAERDPGRRREMLEAARAVYRRAIGP
jgi:TetR/AcrR family transcriptional regulator, transcriptional repressor for nem operon